MKVKLSPHKVPKIFTRKISGHKAGIIDLRAVLALNHEFYFRPSNSRLDYEKSKHDG